MKECFGNYMKPFICEGHHTCKEKGCMSKTNIDKGECDCPYKASCHIPRQHLRAMQQKDFGYKTEDCGFYKLLKPQYDKLGVNKMSESNKQKSMTMEELIDAKVGTKVTMACSECESLEEHEKLEDGTWKCLWCGAKVIKLKKEK